MIHFKTGKYSLGDLPLRSVAYALLSAVVVAFGLHVVISAGPAFRAAAQDALVRAIADEDQHVCGQFGMHAGTEAFSACCRELANVRRRQMDRDNAAAQGIL